MDWWKGEIFHISGEAILDPFNFFGNQFKLLISGVYVPWQLKSLIDQMGFK